jgi:arylsulfatase A-like enzyme
MKLPTTNLLEMEGQAPACPPRKTHDDRGHAGACPSSAAAVVLGLLALWLSFQPTSAADRPNVLFILADDQGSADLGCYGAKDLETPHTDALAARGVRFTQFYSAAPVCSPSRAGILTGRYPVRAGVPGNCASQPGEKGALPPEEVTMAEMFHAAGYATAQIGKWHLGYTPETHPLRQGFDHSFGHMGGCIDNRSHFFYWSGPNIHDLWRNGEEVFHDGEFFPDLMVKEASRFIEANRAKPFFIYYALNSPHYPYQGDAKWLEHFKALPYPRNLYAAFVAAQDERLGVLFAKLDELGLRENTIVVFQSDNGHSTEERAHFGGGSAGSNRGAKFSLFEGGIRLPAILSWPDRLPGGETRDQIAHACDWMPTLAELCGVPLPDKTLDGLSLAKVLADGAVPSPHDGKSLHWQVGEGPKADWAVREGEWKLIGRSRDTTDGHSKAILENFLVNLAEDPGETTNQAATRPEIVARLRKIHESPLE